MSKLQLLIPLDGSDFSRQILPAINRLFSAEHYAVNLLHVAELPESYAYDMSPARVSATYSYYTFGHDKNASINQHPISDQHWENYRQSLESRLRDDVSALSSFGYEVHVSVHFGDPVDEIVAFTQQTQVDVIAMATHGRTGLGRLFMGSVAQDVLQKLPIPVLLLRAHVPEKESVTTKQTQSESEKRMEAATLAGYSGQGVLSILRSDSGEIIEMQGSWRPQLQHAKLTALRTAQHNQSRVTYEGPVSDPDAKRYGVPSLSTPRATVDVRLTSMGVYNTERGEETCVINFCANTDTPHGLSQDVLFGPGVSRPSETLR